LTFDEHQRRLLDAVLDGLIPGGDAWPSAGSLGLHDEIVRLARLSPGHPESLIRLLDQLDDGFPDESRQSREETLRRLETADADTFGVAVVLAYNAYYTHPAVLAVVAEKTGYEARPPQPLGYELEPFDESLLSAIKKRPPFYRHT